MCRDFSFCVADVLTQSLLVVFGVSAGRKGGVKFMEKTQILASEIMTKL